MPMGQPPAMGDPSQMPGFAPIGASGQLQGLTEGGKAVSADQGFARSPTGSGMMIPTVGNIQPRRPPPAGMADTGGGGGTRQATLSAGGPLGLLMAVGFAAHARAREKKVAESESMANDYMDIVGGPRGKQGASEWVAQDNKRMRWYSNAVDPKKQEGPEYEGVQRAFQQKVAREQQEQQYSAAMEALRTQSLQREASAQRATIEAQTAQINAQTRQQGETEKEWKDRQEATYRQNALNQRMQIARMQSQTSRQNVQDRIRSTEGIAQAMRQNQLTLQGMRDKTSLQKAQQFGMIFKAATAMNQDYNSVQRSINDIDSTMSKIDADRARLSTWQEWTTDKADQFSAQMDGLQKQRDALEKKLQNLDTGYQGLVGQIRTQQLGGGPLSPAGGGGAPQYRRNPTTNQVEQSVDGGKTWR